MNLTNQFLIATPVLSESEFKRTIIYVCQHDHTGAMGLVINRATDSRINEIFDQLEIKFINDSPHKARVFAGGPVQPENGFVIHSPIGKWDSSYPVGDSLAITSSRDILKALANNDGPERWMITLGHAGWTTGQLEDEIIRNDWLVAKSSDKLIFDTPVNLRWESALASIGIKDHTQLSHFSGKA